MIPNFSGVLLWKHHTLNDNTHHHAKGLTSWDSRPKKKKWKRNNTTVFTKFDKSMMKIMIANYSSTSIIS